MLQFTLLVISQHTYTLAQLPPWILKRVSTFGCFDIDAMFVFQVNFGAIGRKSRRHMFEWEAQAPTSEWNGERKR